MKNILFLSIVAFVFSLSSCDYNDKNFEGLEDMAKPTHRGPFTLTYVGPPFTEAKPAKNKLQDWLYTQIFTADTGTIANVTYDFKKGEPEQLIQQTDEYVFKGYTDKWVFVRTLPRFLLNESFEDSGAANTPTTLEGWLNIAVQGTFAWTAKDYDNNSFSQFSANKAPGICEGWLITPQYSIKEGMVFLFDVCIGYYNADCLQVMVSTDFDGSEEGIASATWEDITSSFNIPKVPTSGYGTFSPAGEFDLAQYNNQKIHIGFKYLGDGKNSKTTTYRLDNVFVGYK